jgi:hypothetical protein
MDDQKILIVDLYYGTCNRFRAYASSKVLADQTNRKLIVKWSIDIPHMSANIEDILDMDIEKIEEMPEGKIFNFIKYPYDSIDLFVKELERDTSVVLCNIMLPLHLDFDPHNAKFDVQINKIRNSLTEPIMKNVRLVQENISLKEDERLITLHWREWTSLMGDGYVKYILAKKNFDKDVEMENFIKRIVEELDVNPKTKFYISSDSSEVINHIKSIDILSDKIYSNNTRDSSIDISRKSITDIQDSMVDWYLLGSGDYIIGTSGSSFSDTASCSTKERRKINIGVDPWY